MVNSDKEFAIKLADMRTRPRYYVLKGKEPKPVGSVIEWANSFEHDTRLVVATRLSHTVRVSTVFLGIDHNFYDSDGPPLLFETMIFGGPHDQYQDRCSTWEQAHAMHNKAVRVAKGEEKADDE